MVDESLMADAVAVARRYFDRHPSNRSLRSRVSDACFYTVASESDESAPYGELGIGPAWYDFYARCLKEFA